jgi:enterobactin synthetase component D
MSFEANLPAFCTAADDSFCWRRPLLHLSVAALRFDETRLGEQDFDYTGIDMPDSLQRAVAKRKAEYLAGRLCAREALHKAIGIEAVPGMGKDRAPRWPTGSVGSITHSNGKAAAIVGNARHYDSVGFDMEFVMPDERAVKLADQILTDTEKRRFQQVMASTPGEFLTLVFSLKESLFKALYPLTQKHFYFEHAELMDWQADGGAKLRLLSDLSENWRSHQKLDAQFVKRPGEIFSLTLIPKAY